MPHSVTASGSMLAWRGFLISPPLGYLDCCYSSATLDALPIKHIEFNAIVYVLLHLGYVKWIYSYCEAVILHIKQKVCIF